MINSDRPFVAAAGLEAQTRLAESRLWLYHRCRAEATLHRRAQRQESETGTAGLPAHGTRGAGSGCLRAGLPAEVESASRLDRTGIRGLRGMPSAVALIQS